MKMINPTRMRIKILLKYCNKNEIAVIYIRCAYRDVSKKLNVSCGCLVMSSKYIH